MHHHNLPDFDRDLCGYMASALVLGTFSMKSMDWLRITAITSNCAFILYAVMADLQPVLVLHSILLPLNIFRLVQPALARMAAKHTTGSADVAASPLSPV